MAEAEDTGRAHSIIGASGYDRWSRCPGSVRLQRVAEDYGMSSSSGYAREGTAAHLIAADCIENDRDTWEWVGEHVEVEGDTFVVDDEMAEAVQVWVDTIRKDEREYYEETGELPIIHVEITFDLRDIRDEMFGTSDIVMLMPKWGLIRVYDYKHGVGIPVDVVRNGQLMYYAVGALHDLKWVHSNMDAVELIVVQPRNDHYLGPVRRWRTTFDDLMDWMDNELLPAVDRTREPDAPLHYGDHCRFCPAKTFCPALHELAQEALNMGDKVKPLSDEQLGEWLQKRDALRHFLKGLDDEAYHRLTHGNKVPGYKLVPKQSKRVWTDGAEKEIKAQFGKQGFNIAPKTPAQLEKMKGGEELVKRLAYKPETGLTLAPASDNRPEVQSKKAADVFADY